MKSYPFHELDYLTREREVGFQLVTAYLQEPSEPNLRASQKGVRWDVKRYFDGQFWFRVKDIARSEDDLPEKIQSTLDCCFSLAFDDIKKRWYKANDEHKHDLKKQFDFSLHECEQGVLNKSEWDDFRQQYQISHKRFVDRLIHSLDGYDANPNDDSLQTGPSTVAVPVEKDARRPFAEETVPARHPFGYNRGTYYQNEQEYEAFIERAWIVLGRNRLVTAPSKAAFRKIFLGRATEPIIWTGPVNKLHHLIARLFDEGVICGESGKWQLTVTCFRLDTGPITIPALHRTKSPVGYAGHIIEQIASDLIG